MSDTDRPASKVEEADPDATSTLLVVVVGGLLVVISVLFVQGLYGMSTRAEFERKVVSETPRELQELRATQRERLLGGAWVDKGAGVVSIPIERAMELVVKEAATPARAPEGTR